jgi:hypothetical protein
MERCRSEIVVIEDQLRAGHPDLQGLCLALADWSAELRILGAEQETAAEPGGACGQCQGLEADTARMCANGAANTGLSLCFSSRHQNEEKPPGLNPAAGRSDLPLVQLLME